MRRRKDEKNESDESVEAEAVGPVTGPWDASDRDTETLGDYLDLGALRVRPVEGLDVQLPVDGDDGTIGSVVFMAPDAALEIRAFAAKRSGGLWDEVRSEILDQVTELSGDAEESEGPYGTELRVAVDAETADGQEGVQVSRIIGIDGPRWLLRATFLGQAALEPSDDGPLMQALQDVVVVRGDGPMAPRSPLNLTLPTDAIHVEN